MDGTVETKMGGGSGLLCIHWGGVGRPLHVTDTCDLPLGVVKW